MYKHLWINMLNMLKTIAITIAIAIIVYICWVYGQYGSLPRAVTNVSGAWITLMEPSKVRRMGLKLNAQSEAFGLKDVNGRTGLTKHRLNHDLSGLIARSSGFPTFTQDVEFYSTDAHWKTWAWSSTTIQLLVEGCRLYQEELVAGGPSNNS